jgi:hypothetical protein
LIQILEESGGCGIECIDVTEDRISTRLTREPMTRADWTTHDYNVHFSIGIRNNDHSERTVSLEIEGGTWDSLPEQEPLLYSATSADGPWRKASYPSRTDLKKRYAVKLFLGPQETVYIANTYPRSLKVTEENCKAVADAANAHRFVYGKSGQNRDLTAYVFGSPKEQPTLLVTSGFHPPEPDPWGAEEIIKWLGTNEAATLRERFAVVVIPIANPDGYSIQTQGSNAADVNLYWGFHAEDTERCPEASALLNYCHTLKPLGYIDFHCYTFQLGKTPGGYQKPPAVYSNLKLREAAKSLYTKHAECIGGKPVLGFSTYAPTTLGARLTAAFDTLTLAKYHLHLAEGEDGCRTRALSVFKLLAETLESAELVQQPEPRRSSILDFVHYLRVIWAGLLRPVMGLARRGRFAEIRFDRSGLDAP